MPCGKLKYGREIPKHFPIKYSKINCKEKSKPTLSTKCHFVITQKPNNFFLTTHALKQGIPYTVFYYISTTVCCVLCFSKAIKKCLNISVLSSLHRQTIEYRGFMNTCFPGVKRNLIDFFKKISFLLLTNFINNFKKRFVLNHIHFLPLTITQPKYYIH